MLRQVILKCTITSLKVSLQANAKLTAKLTAKLETLFEKLLMIYTEHWRKRELFLSNLHEPSTWVVYSTVIINIALMENGLVKSVTVQAHAEHGM